MNRLLFTTLFVVLLLKRCAPETQVRTCPSNSAEYVAPSGGKLPEHEVDAIKALRQRTKRAGDLQDNKLGDSITCNTGNPFTCICNCATKICNIKTLSFHGYELMGEIPEEIGDLSSLMRIDLSGNILSGEIPKSFAKLAKLFSMDLSDNLLEGSIPRFLGNMTKLIDIFLSNNRFRGSIPEEISQLPSLERLQLDGNRFTGNIPYHLGNIINLKKLSLSDNQFSGLLPVELGHLIKLKSLLVANNQLHGELPSSFFNLMHLNDVDLRGNNFNGTLPKHISNWKDLRTLSLIGNKFQGPLPTEISSLTLLNTLHVSDLIEDSDGSSFPNVSTLKYMKSLILRNCTITHGIPDYIVNMRDLYYLDLSFNKLTGQIPNVSLAPQQQPLPQNVKYIFLRGNKLNGSLPEWLKNTSRQSYVDVSENNFTGPIGVNSSKNFNTFKCCFITTILTDQKWQANNYTCQSETKYRDLYINCGGAKTTVNGNDYKSDNNPNGGSTFVLSDDKRWGYSSMGKFIYARKDVYLQNRTCNMSMDDSSLYETARLAPISLKYYGFCLKNGNYTVKLHFAEILWEPIMGLDNKTRRVFDVEIQGKKVLSNFNIEKAAGGVNKDITKVFPNTTVNNSRLEIHLFWNGKGSISYPTVYYGPLVSAISAVRVEKKRNRLYPLAIAGIVVASLLFPLLVLVLIMERVKHLKYEELKRKSTGQFYSLKEIKKATQNFSVNNKLGTGGSGSVYKGILPGDNAIAVKQFSRTSGQGNFVNEIGHVFALKHQNLVKLLGCCVEYGQRILIYEYMENNSLGHVLFGSQEHKSKLDWKTRVKICHDIAKGLTFLHEESELKLIHSDIKPTNILLDKDLTAKITDFGFAKIHEGQDVQKVICVAGTDFGIVLLEIVSGKNSSTKQSDTYLLNLALVKAMEGNLIDLVDPDLVGDYKPDEAKTILNLAMKCTHQSYTLRPIMSEVVKVLEGKIKLEEITIGKHNSMEDSAMANVTAGPSQSGSTSQAGISNNTLTSPATKETEGSTVSAGNTSEVVNGNGGTSGNN